MDYLVISELVNFTESNWEILIGLEAGLLKNEKEHSVKSGDISYNDKTHQKTRMVSFPSQKDWMCSILVSDRYKINAGLNMAFISNQLIFDEMEHTIRVMKGILRN